MSIHAHCPAPSQKRTLHSPEWPTTMLNCSDTLAGSAALVGVTSIAELSDPEPWTMDQSNVRNDQLDEILAQYLIRTDRGESVDREAFLAAYPECADELRAYFADSDAVVKAFQETEASSEQTLELPLVLGDYQLLDKLGAGGMGTVYRARHVRLDRIVAIKLLPKNRTGDPGVVARFEREIRAAGQFSHPTIVHALDARDIAGTVVLVMEYVDGINLSELIGRFGALSIADACELIRQTAIGLQCAHEHGLVHRDIKPSNLMVTPTGQVKILDLGLALLCNERPDGGELTSDGQVMGTADYMAPEQVDDSHHVDIRADIYSLGCTLYKLLTACAPFSGPTYKTAFDKMTGHVRNMAPAIRSLRANVPVELVAIVERMMAKDPGARFATPAELCEAIAPLASGNNLPSLIVRAIDRHSSQASRGDATGNTREHLSSHQTETVSHERELPASGHGIFRRRKTLLAATAGAIVVLGAFMTIVTDRGTLEIQTFDDDVRVAVSQNGEEVTIVDTKTNQTAKLHSGQYEVAIAEGKAGLRLSTDRFTLRRGEKVLVEVSRLPEKIVPQPSAVTGTAQFSSDDELLQATTQWNNLLPLVDLQGGFVVGDWEMAKDGLRVTGSPQLRKRIEVPVAPIGSYEFRVRFTRTAGADEVVMILPVRWGSTSLLLRNRGGEMSVLVDVQDPHAAGREATRALPLTNNEPHVVLVSVKLTGDQAEIQASFDHLPFLSWRGPQKALTQAGGYDLRRAQTLGIGAKAAVITFHAAELRLMDGTAQRLPTPHDAWADPVATIESRGGRVEKNSLGQVVKVDVSGPTAITDRDLPQLNAFPHLRSLNVNASSISDLGMQTIADMTSLEELVLAGTVIGDEGLRHIGKLAQLKRLYLYPSAVSDVGMRHLIGLKKLEFLDAFWTGDTEKGMACVKQIQTLKSLYIDNKAIDDATIEHICELKNLEHLAFLATSGLTSRHLERLKFLANLRALDFTCGSISGQDLALLEENFPNLEKLFLFNNPLKNADLKYLSGLTKLTELALDLTTIGNNGLMHLRPLKKLRLLKIRRTLIDDAAVEHLTSLKNLRELDLGETGVTSVGVATLRTALPDCNIIVDARIEEELRKQGAPVSSATAAPPTLAVLPSPAVAPFDGKTARDHQEAWAKHLGVPVEMTNSIGMKFMLIPPGEFDMGATPEEIGWAREGGRKRGEREWYFDRLASEAPRHHLKLTRPVYLAVSPVTQGEYKKLIGVNPSSFAGKPVDTSSDVSSPDEGLPPIGRDGAKRVAAQDTSDYPVELVSWTQAIEFCRLLSELPAEEGANHKYRLPTEAEWEFACRAGTTTPWWIGDDRSRLLECAWFADNADATTHPVGQKQANPWGLGDMHGNVSQWCQDGYDPKYYGSSPATDPLGPTGSKLRVARGGNWGYTEFGCRSAHRSYYSSSSCYRYLGFRVCMPLSQ